MRKHENKCDRLKVFISSSVRQAKAPSLHCSERIQGEKCSYLKPLCFLCNNGLHSNSHRCSRDGKSSRRERHIFADYFAWTHWGYIFVCVFMQFFQAVVFSTSFLQCLVSLNNNKGNKENKLNCQVGSKFFKLNLNIYNNDT